MSQDGVRVRRDGGLRRLVVLVGGLAVALLVLFLAVEPLLPPDLVDPSRWTEGASPATALGSISLLAADVVLPVPSSLVMVANGALFGIVIGTAVSTVGTMSSALIAFGIGRRAQRPTRAWIGEPSTGRLDRMMARHGVAAVIATRPIPIVAEITAGLAGSGRLGGRRFLVGSLVGSLATSFVYAAIGVAATHGRGWLALPVAAVLAAVAWLVGCRVVATDAAVAVVDSAMAPHPDGVDSAETSAASASSRGAPPR